MEEWSKIDSAGDWWAGNIIGGIGVVIICLAIYAFLNMMSRRSSSKDDDSSEED